MLKNLFMTLFSCTALTLFADQVQDETALDTLVQPTSQPEQETPSQPDTSDLVKEIQEGL